MSNFYDDFKFAVECCGLPAPSSEFFNTPVLALTSLGTACGALEALGPAAQACKLEGLASYCYWLTTIGLRTPVGATQVLPSALGMEGRAAIMALQNAPKLSVALRAGVYVGGCAAAAYLGVLVGAAAYATQQKFLSVTNKPLDGFFHWWYGGYATDARTAEMQKELAKRREFQQLQLMKTKLNNYL